LFAPLELGSEAASDAWSVASSVASSEDLAEAQAEAETDDMVIGSSPRKLAPRSPPIASGLDLVKIRHELNAALDLLNFDGLP
jgi:hypothetical protein